MSKSSAVKESDNFTRGHKTSTKTTQPSLANIAEVLRELKSLRSDFGAKLNNIDTRLTRTANAFTALEGKVTETKCYH